MPAEQPQQHSPLYDSDPPFCPICEPEIAGSAILSNYKACEDCRRRYPPSLIRAAYDEFEYCLRLTSGELVFFSKAVIHGNFAWLDTNTIYEVDVEDKVVPHHPRGIDVNIRQIVWCADTGH
jgi:hypothetical protein